jgi:hypothetical protein
MLPTDPFAKRSVAWTSPPAPMAYTSTGEDSTSALTVSMKCPPSPVNRDPSRSSSRYQLPASSRPALTR